MGGLDEAVVQDNVVVEGEGAGEGGWREVGFAGHERDAGEHACRAAAAGADHLAV